MGILILYVNLKKIGGLTSDLARQRTTGLQSEKQPEDEPIKQPSEDISQPKAPNDANMGEPPAVPGYPPIPMANPPIKAPPKGDRISMHPVYIPISVDPKIYFPPVKAPAPSNPWAGSVPRRPIQIMKPMHPGYWGYNTPARMARPRPAMPLAVAPVAPVPVPTMPVPVNPDYSPVIDKPVEKKMLPPMNLDVGNAVVDFGGDIDE